MAADGNSYFTVLTQAVGDMVENGFDSAERVRYWQRRLREAAEQAMLSDDQMTIMLKSTLSALYRKMVVQGGVLKFHSGVGRFTLERVAPHLRAELDRRIMTAYDLIKLNREQMVALTQRRFAGWATSIPKGGPAEAQKQEVKAKIQGPLRKLPFETRRVLIDQGHKLVSSINEVIAQDGGALGGFWYSHWRQAGYDYREDHKDRDGVFYLVRGSWAEKGGLITKAGHQYIDEITRPAEEPFCRCRYNYTYLLRDVPKSCLTKKGQLELERAKRVVAEARA